MHLRAKLFLLLFSGSLLVSGAEKFDRFFSWSPPRDDHEAELAKRIGITDVFLQTGSKSSDAQIETARKHHFPVYAVFTPMQVKELPPQVMPPEVQKYKEFLVAENTKIPPKNAAERKARQRHAAEIRARCDYRYGGEPEKKNEKLECLYYPPPCFLGKEALEKSKRVLEKICADRRLSGIAFDFIGYADYRSCRCSGCDVRYAAWLRARGLTDTPAQRTLFFRDELVDYNNALIDWIRQLRPDMKTATHIYPVFLPDPLYGNRLKTDYCGQTAAWYFLWTPEKIRNYTREICSQEKKYHANAVGVPFLGLYDTGTHPGFHHKSPERLELELQSIIEGGGKHLMMLSPRDVWEKPEYVKVFRRYLGHCRSESSPGGEK